MKPNTDFLNKSSQFWGYVRIISEKVKYSVPGENMVKKHTFEEVKIKLSTLDINVDDNTLEEVLAYIHYRADILNNNVQYQLMEKEEAKPLFEQFKKIHEQEGYTCKLPLNKQKGDKREFSFLTGMVNILTERALRHYAYSHGLEYGKDITFDEDPGSLSFFKNDHQEIQGAFSRRFDGALPSITNPVAVWEIKEYYYSKTFGSRVADGVYETQLDGYEIKDLSKSINKDIKHLYIIDHHHTWWTQGKSYLCRIVDMLHLGLVDEVLFGKEIINRWEDMLFELMEAQHDLLS